MIVNKQESMASLIHDTSHNKGLYYGFRDAILSCLFTIMVQKGKAATVTRESGEVAACSLARERRRRQSLAFGPLRGKEKTPEPLLIKQKQLPSASRPA